MIKIILAQGFCPLKFKITQSPDGFCLNFFTLTRSIDFFWFLVTEFVMKYKKSLLTSLQYYTSTGEIKTHPELLLSSFEQQQIVIPQLNENVWMVAWLVLTTELNCK